PGHGVEMASDLLTMLQVGLPGRNDVTTGLHHLAQGARATAAGNSQAEVSADDSSLAVRASVSGTPEDRVLGRIRYDAFFGVRRVESLPAHELRLGVLDVVARVCDDVAEAFIGLPELTELLHGVRDMLAAVELAQPQRPERDLAPLNAAGPDTAEAG